MFLKENIDKFFYKANSFTSKLFCDGDFIISRAVKNY